MARQEPCATSSGAVVRHLASCVPHSWYKAVDPGAGCGVGWQSILPPRRGPRAVVPSHRLRAAAVGSAVPEPVGQGAWAGGTTQREGRGHRTQTPSPMGLIPILSVREGRVVGTELARPRGKWSFTWNKMENSLSCLKLANVTQSLQSQARKDTSNDPGSPPRAPAPRAAWRAAR